MKFYFVVDFNPKFIKFYCDYIRTSLEFKYKLFKLKSCSNLDYNKIQLGNVINSESDCVLDCKTLKFYSKVFIMDFNRKSKRFHARLHQNTTELI